MDLIVSDFDGTLFFVDESLKKASLELVGKEMPYVEARKLEKNLRNDVYNLAYSKYKNHLIPNNELIDFFRKEKERGAEIFILTARNPVLKEDTNHLLLEHNIPFDELILREDGSIPDEIWKANYLKDLKRSSRIMLFEDKEENIKHVKSVAPVVECYLVNEKGFSKV